MGRDGWWSQMCDTLTYTDAQRGGVESELMVWGGGGGLEGGWLSSWVASWLEG